MIEGVLQHCTSMEVEKNYVDNHGQSEVAFAFCHLLGFQLMPICIIGKVLAGCDDTLRLESVKSTYL
jgi:hypothetical protein